MWMTATYAEQKEAVHVRIEVRDMLVYFCADRGEYAKKHPWSRVGLKFNDWRWDELEVRSCFIPEFYRRGRKEWEPERLGGVITDWLDRFPADEYCLQPAVEALLSREPCLPPLTVLRKTVEQCRMWRRLVIFLPGRMEEEAFHTGRPEEEQAELVRELAGPHLSRINAITVVVREREAFLELSEQLMEEYGIPVRFVEEWGAQSGRGKEETAVLDLRPSGNLSPRTLPERSTYIDAWSLPERERILAAKRRDILYLGACKFLDTFGKNGYNTIVNHQYDT